MEVDTNVCWTIVLLCTAAILQLKPGKDNGSIALVKPR